MMTVTLLLFNYVVEAQVLKRQMIASQGKSLVLKNGIIVSQSVGQQSVIGNFGNENFTVQQGFQQSILSDFSKIFSPVFDAVLTQFYPNPVVDDLNFKFSSEIQGPVNVYIYDMAGRLLFRQEKYAVDNVLTIHSLGFLPRGQFVVNLIGAKYTYVAKIIKK